MSQPGDSVKPDAADLLVRRLAALSEHRQRVAVLAEEASRLGPQAFADVVALIVDRSSRNRQEKEHLALSAIVGYLESDLFSSTNRQAMITHCVKERLPRLLPLLTPTADAQDEDQAPVPDYGTGRTLTLGERKALARRPTRQSFERLLADPHPAVIHNLLRNPHLTEEDVLSLVTRRPSVGKVLEEVWQNSRWRSRYAIKLALAQNPYTPLTVALNVLPQLLRQHLEELLNDARLHPTLRATCRRLLDTTPPDSHNGPLH
jgi:hypothetical protein